MRVLGIDPGSRYLGLGCAEANGNSYRWVGHKVVRVSEDRELGARMRAIYLAVHDAIDEWQPDAVSVESVFFAKNAKSALMLGQARGAALTASATRDLAIFEYPATLVKQTVTGSGRAEKSQVQRMVRALMGGQLQFEREDASDALAVAICHLQHRHRQSLLLASDLSRKGLAQRRPQR